MHLRLVHNKLSFSALWHTEVEPFRWEGFWQRIIKAQRFQCIDFVEKGNLRADSNKSFDIVDLSLNEKVKARDASQTVSKYDAGRGCVLNGRANEVTNPGAS